MTLPLLLKSLRAPPGSDSTTGGRAGCLSRQLMLVMLAYTTLPPSPRRPRPLRPRWGQSGRLQNPLHKLVPAPNLGRPRLRSPRRLRASSATPPTTSRAIAPPLAPHGGRAIHAVNLATLPVTAPPLIPTATAVTVTVVRVRPPWRPLSSNPLPLRRHQPAPLPRLAGRPRLGHRQRLRSRS